MKKTTILLMLCLSLFACKKESQNLENNATLETEKQHSFNTTSLMRYSGSDYSQAISITEANNMIGSYLTSIDYTVNDSSLRSLSFDADTLRSYLNDTTKGKIVTLKMFVAHQPSYIANGNYGVNAGLDARAITLVLVGLGEQGNSIYNRENKVYDHLHPCPSNCPGSALLIE